MKLRDHPLMSYHGFPNWPPRWLPRGDGSTPRVYGEVGVLTEVIAFNPAPQRQQAPELFLFMEYQGRRYIAAVAFNDEAFCRQIGALLKGYYGHTLEEIGGLEVSHFL